MFNQLNNKVASFLTKIIMLPIIFFFLYSLTWVYSMKIMEAINYNVQTITQFIISIVITTIISFLITLFLYLLMVKLSNKIRMKLIDEEFKGRKKYLKPLMKFLLKYINENNFYKGYHYAHLILLYFSGLFTVLLTIEPLLLNEGIIKSEINEDWKLSTLVLFLAISNYTLFNSIVLNNDFKIEFPNFKNIKNK